MAQLWHLRPLGPCFKLINVGNCLSSSSGRGRESLHRSFERQKLSTNHLISVSHRSPKALFQQRQGEHFSHEDQISTVQGRWQTGMCLIRPNVWCFSTIFLMYTRASCTRRWFFPEITQKREQTTTRALSKHFPGALVIAYRSYPGHTQSS